MAGKAKRAAERRAQPATVVDLNLWDVLLGLMEPTDGPEVPERDWGPGEAVPTHASEVKRKEAAATAKATRRNAGQGSRRPKTKRIDEPPGLEK
jgi:hypothetical protein